MLFISGLNFIDVMHRHGGSHPSGVKPPFVPGFECAGVVEELGDEATGVEVSEFSSFMFEYHICLKKHPTLSWHLS